jgi:E3 ubiquitin-protein ligase HUWE1
MTRLAVLLLGPPFVPVDLLDELSGLAEFCTKNRNIIPWPQNTPAERLCPENAAIDLVALRKILEHLHPSLGLGRLDVRRSFGVTDSLPVLLNRFVTSAKPRGVGFVHEKGIDRGGVTRDWYSHLASQITGNCGLDPRGNLFKLNENKSFRLPDPERVDSPQDLEVWLAFGRLTALTVLKEEQLGVDLPVFFWARFLNGHVDLEDLSPELEDTTKFLTAMYFQTSAQFGVDAKKNPEGETIWVPFRELQDEEEETPVNFFNKEQVIERILTKYSPAKLERAFEEMRKGFESLLDRKKIGERVTAADFRRLVSGDDKLDVAQLKEDADGDRSWQPFNWLFDWLTETDKHSQRKFMQFVTGSRSFSRKKIVVNPGFSSQGYNPASHTCFNAIHLPNYKTKEDLVESMNLAILVTGFGLE